MHDFCGNAPGPSRSVSSTETAKEACCRYFTDEVWDLLVVETNRFAARCTQTPTTTGVRAWHDVKVVEMQAFVGVIMLMGICSLPRIENYWTTSHPLIKPRLAQVMTRITFEQILRYIHLYDSD